MHPCASTAQHTEAVSLCGVKEELAYEHLPMLDRGNPRDCLVEYPSPGVPKTSFRGRVPAGFRFWTRHLVVGTS